MPHPDDPNPFGAQSLYSRATTAPAATSSPQSPFLKKFSPMQDRRVNTILVEALQLVDFSKDELVVMEKAIKRLRDAINGFSMLVDKQVNIIGAESLEERGRVKADIQDLCENLKNSNALLDNTCARMKKFLGTGKNHILMHKRKLVNRAVNDLVDASESSCASHQCSVNEYTINGSVVRSPGRIRPQQLYALNLSAPSSPERIRSAAPVVIAPGTRKHSPTKLPLAVILDSTPPKDPELGPPCSKPVQMAPEFFESVLDTVGLLEKEFLDLRDLNRFLQEMLTFSIARSSTLTFMGKAHHRKHISQYASELAKFIVQELRLTPQAPGMPIILPQNTLYDFMCQEPYYFDQLLNAMHVANPSDMSFLSPPVATETYGTSPAAATATFLNGNPFAEQFSRNGGILNGGQVVQLVVTPPVDPEKLETAEQTLSMAKLLHELATAESEARNGNRMSIRSPVSRSKEFSKAYLSTAKELMLKESGLT